MPSPPTRRARPRTACWSDRTRSMQRWAAQVADHGYLVSGDAKLKVTQVKRPRRAISSIPVSCWTAPSTLTTRLPLPSMRSADAICRNHTATHLLQKALRARSWASMSIRPAAIRTTRSPTSTLRISAPSAPAELAEVERRVNERRFTFLPSPSRTCPAHRGSQKMGAMALFGEKYGSVVHALSTPAAEHRVLRRHPCHEHRTDRLLQDFERVQRLPVSAALRLPPSAC